MYSWNFIAAPCWVYLEIYLSIYHDCCTPSASDESDEYVFYCNRPEWADVEPLPQDDGPYPVVRIAYTDKCEFCM